MSTFRKFGGINYSANNNITRSFVSNSEHLNVSTYYGQENSKEIFKSHIDMSGNSILNVSTLYFIDGSALSTGNGISANTDGISANAAGITANAHGISANADAINAIVGGTLGVSANAEAIAKNVDGISANAHGITVNADAINSLGGVTAGVSANAAGITVNAHGVSANVNGISANAAGITVNAHGISANALAISNIAQSEWTTAEPTGITASTIYYNGSIQVGASGASGVTTNAEIQIIAPGNATLNIIADTHDESSDLFHPSIMMTQDVGSTLNTIASTIGIGLDVPGATANNNSLRIISSNDVYFYTGAGYTFDSSGTRLETLPNNPATIVDGGIDAIAFNATSDYRIKNNVRDLDARHSVDNLKPKFYKNTLLNKMDIGLIAHELQEHYPFLVNGEQDGDKLQKINYIGLVGILIKEIQELKKRVSLLEK